MALLIAGTATAQTVEIDTLAAKQPWAPFQAYSFPKVGIEHRQELAERINKDLALDLLEVDVDTLNGPVFQHVWGDADGTMPRLNTLTWTSARHLRNVLSFEFSGEACGAYCEGFSIHYSYDLRTGNRLVFDSLFTQKGLLAVNEWVGKRWSMAVEREIVLLEDSLRKPDGSADERDAITTALALYRDCLAARSGLPPYVEDFELLATELRLRVARCSAHVDQDADALGSVLVVLPYADLTRYLKPEVLALIR